MQRSLPHSLLFLNGDINPSFDIVPLSVHNKSRNTSATRISASIITPETLTLLYYLRSINLDQVKSKSERELFSRVGETARKVDDLLEGVEIGVCKKILLSSFLYRLFYVIRAILLVFQLFRTSTCKNPSHF